MSTPARDALLRPLAFFRVIGHAPTLCEWTANSEWKNDEWRSANGESRITNDELRMMPMLRSASRSAYPDCDVGTNDASVERGAVEQVARQLIEDGDVRLSFGRIIFPDADGALIERQRADELWMPRKLRVARRVARWLARLSSVRFVALCNTTATGHARDEGDLDFFIVVRRGTIMQTRALAALPFKLLRRRPGERDGRDAVCLSYFVADDGLDLSSHMLQEDADTSVGIPTSHLQNVGERRDVYFRYWFLSLLPLYDDGVSQQLWDANRAITSQHPFARPWIVSPDLRVNAPFVRLPIFSSFESVAASIQQGSFPNAIREIMNRDTRVIVTDKVLKFHVEDRREEYRQRYEDVCREKGI